ncbi:hypothetical protein LUZ60_002377 [Juncus effusus]|nr:hypothetical protein LUZ60_002377 [Juncus effusus]
MDLSNLFFTYLLYFPTYFIIPLPISRSSFRSVSLAPNSLTLPDRRLAVAVAGEMDDPLDFEKEDLLLPRVAPKRKKVIELDDLLADFYAEKNKAVKNKSKRSKSYDSDEDDKKTHQNEITFCKFVDACQKQVSEIGADEEAPIWGQRAFGLQKPYPLLEKPPIENCQLLRAFSQNNLASILSFDAEQVDTFLEGLLINGWLMNLVTKSGSLENSIASWIFQTMLYSSNEELQVSACDFWCNILQSKIEAGELLVKVGWFPNYSILKNALTSYGYIWPSNNTNNHQEIQTDSTNEGPPVNITSWIKSLSTLCQIRKVRQIFSISESEELLQVIISLHLDRNLLGLALSLTGCLQSIIHYFTDSEWTDSCTRVAESIALRVQKDLNCLRIVECIVGSDSRIKQLKSQLALHLLIIFFENKVKSDEEILKLLISMNVKEKKCDLFRMYLCLNLTDSLLLPHQPFEENSKIVSLWRKFLRNCSSQISTTDWRNYAAKVRNKASYLLHNMKLKGNNY